MNFEMYLEPNQEILDNSELRTRTAKQANVKSRIVRFIDLFAGMGGTRVGFELACQALDVKHACVFTSEIKPHAIQVYKANFQDDKIAGDITQIDPQDIPDFDFLLGGFPCQPFSMAGKRKGLQDERGNLFFNILDILKTKQPKGFLLENVEGLASDNGGQTIKLIEQKLVELGYKINWRVLDASNFGVPQQRKRLYIAGHKERRIDLSDFPHQVKLAGDIVEKDVAFKESDFAKLLGKHFSYKVLQGKSIKDKRGGNDNIHSWDIEYKGAITATQKTLLNLMLKQRRQKKWAIAKGMEWMDGMPLTTAEIATFFPDKNLQKMLDDLLAKRYLKFEHPKSVVIKDGVRSRVPDLRIEKGYNIVAGKLSFPITKILDPKGFAPTLVATEAGKLAVALPQGVRPVTVREGLRLSGFPDSYFLDSINYRDAFDLLGNTVMPPVIAAVCERLIH